MNIINRKKPYNKKTNLKKYFKHQNHRQLGTLMNFVYARTSR